MMFVRVLLLASLALAPAVALAGEGKGTDRQSACSIARDQARKEAGKKAMLGDCKCEKPAADGSLTCRVTAQ